MTKCFFKILIFLVVGGPHWTLSRAACLRRLYYSVNFCLFVCACVWERDSVTWSQHHLVIRLWRYWRFLLIHWKKWNVENLFLALANNEKSLFCSQKNKFTWNFTCWCGGTWHRIRANDFSRCLDTLFEDSEKTFFGWKFLKSFWRCWWHPNRGGKVKGGRGQPGSFASCWKFNAVGSSFSRFVKARSLTEDVRAIMINSK